MFNHRILTTRNATLKSRNRAFAAYSVRSNTYFGSLYEKAGQYDKATGEYEAHQDDEDEEATQRRAADLRFLAKVSNVIYLQLNRGKDIEVSQIASAMCMSDRLFYRKMTALTDSTPTVYIQRVKIKKAKSLLDGDSRMSFGEIANRCGSTGSSCGF